MESIILIIIGVVTRLLPHAPNVTAIGGIAYVSGRHFPLWKSIIIVVVSMMITDIFLGLHSVMWATYGSFLITIMIGKFWKKQKNSVVLLGSVTLSSIVFYLLTNFAVWVSFSSMYPKTVAGLIDCYVMALPFFRNSLLGDYFYTGIFLALYEIVPRFFLQRNVLRT